MEHKLLRMVQRQREILAERVSQSVVKALRYEQFKAKPDVKSATRVLVDSAEEYADEYAGRHQVRESAVTDAEDELVGALKREREAALRQLAESIKHDLQTQKSNENQEVGSVRDELVQDIKGRLDVLKDDFAESENQLGGQVGALHRQIHEFRTRAEQAEQGMLAED